MDLIGPGSGYQSESMEQFEEDFAAMTELYNKSLQDRSFGRAVLDVLSGSPRKPRYYVEMGGNPVRATSTFLKWLNTGSKSTKVYVGMDRGRRVYAGITRQLIRVRQAQHGTRFTIQKITRITLTPHQARAVEQALILRFRGPDLMNKINSISPKRTEVYEQAVKWGDDFLKEIGF